MNERRCAPIMCVPFVPITPYPPVFNAAVHNQHVFVLSIFLKNLSSILRIFAMSLKFGHYKDSQGPVGLIVFSGLFLDFVK